MNVPVNEALTFIRQWQDAKIGLERIGDIHNQESEDSYIRITNDLRSRPMNLTVSNLSFYYDGSAETKALNQINLEIPKGKVTAVVGTSGSGKTTLMKLLLKFYQPHEGKIELGGRDLKNINSTELRKLCGVVMQDGYLFSDSIAENIALGDDNINYDRLYHVSDTANILEFIQSLPLGFETRIGQDGKGLSQGQKQRILIARALYKNPEILFFDEATSSLDANNEKVITSKLKKIFKGKTVVIIAHRLSTVKNADQIVVLEKGAIKEFGTHNELVEKKGDYYNLVRNQLELGN